MAILANNTTISGTGFLQLPADNSQTGNTNGQLRFNPTQNKIEWYNSGTQNGWTYFGIPFQARDVQVAGYLHGGYAASTTWNNTNRMTFATDTSVNLGDGTQEASHNYQSSAFNLRRNFTWGAGGSHCAPASNIICFDMVTEQAVTSGYTRNMPGNTLNTGTIQKEHYFSYLSPYSYLSAAIYEFNLTTETLGTTYGTGGNNQWGAWTENFGIFYGGTEKIFNFATRTPYDRGASTALAGDAYQHNMQTRQATTIAGREGNPSTNWRVTNYQNNASYNAIGAKPAYSGEENMVSARDWAYCMGFYNGSHVNTTYKLTFSTFAGYTGSSSMEPKGKSGNSSGTMSWRP
jgi:hypothetical protein